MAGVAVLAENSILLGRKLDKRIGFLGAGLEIGTYLHVGTTEIKPGIGAYLLAVGAPPDAMRCFDHDEGNTLPGEVFGG